MNKDNITKGTAKDYLDKQGFSFDHFTKLTSTGISEDGYNIIRFAEDYASSQNRELMEANKELLRCFNEAVEVIQFYTKAGQTKRVEDGVIEYDVDAGPLYNYKYISLCDEGQKAKSFIQKHSTK